MKENRYLVTPKVKVALMLIAVFMVMSFSTQAYAKWSYGIGTGFTRLSIEGDIGFDTSNAGSVLFDVDLSPEDLSDVTESAFGFGGYATDGTWMIQYSLFNIVLEDQATQGAVSATVDFEMRGGEITVAYPFYKEPSVTLSVLGGARYTAHDTDGTVTSGATTVTWDVNEEWADALVGLVLGVPLAEKWNWNTRVDAGFGGSDGTYNGNTAVSWRFYENWSGSIFAKYTAVDFEEGTRGNADWYRYDVNEFGAGLSFLYHF